MKNKLVLMLLALTAALSARADLIWYEGFNYSNAPYILNLTNASSGVWSNFSGGKNDMFVSNNVLQVSSTSATQVPSRTDDDCRYFVGAAYPANPTNVVPAVVYASFTVICTNLPSQSGNYFASFYNTAKGFCGRVQALTTNTVAPNTWRLGITDNASSTNPPNAGLFVDLALNTPYQVVARMDPITLQAATVWVNPLSESDPSYTATDGIGFMSTNGINSFAFRQASGAIGVNNWFCYITNLATATTFAEAATNVWPTNAVAPTIVTQPKNTTNFVGVPSTFYAVANGQGLASMTYQWYKGGSAFSNPNGNSPVLPFSNPQTTDSGSYTLVATTPFGLSVTSSPAYLSISAAPVPPTITSGPASQSVYIGQSVIFSVTVTSPGNLSYQWKSNNVNIVGQNNSTLELDNVQTNFAANYSVGVTNDVVPNGVVSTNAVLTVKTPAVVSIAYLHTLVDPTTFAPTNVPATIPYTVTGVVTTFTNITSGNTASYYLQDGTGGINIFATFGSTFRPAQGDIVTFTGVLSSFTGLELDADTTDLLDTSYSIVGHTNTLPTPIAIPYTVTNNQAYANTTAGSLVSLYDVYFGTNAGATLSTSANQAIRTTNSLGQVFFLEFFDLDLDTAGMVLPTYASKVTGVLYGGAGTLFSVAVTKWSDIDTNAVPSPIPLTITPVGSTVVLSWSDPSFTLQGSTNVHGPYTNITTVSPYTNTVSGSSLYFRLYQAF